MVLRQRATCLLASLTLATAAAATLKQETRPIIPRNTGVEEAEASEKWGPLARTLSNFEHGAHRMKGFSAEGFEHQSSLGKPWTQQRGFVDDLPPFGDSQASGAEPQASLRGGLWSENHFETITEDSTGIESEGSSTWEEVFWGVFDVLRELLVRLRFLCGVGWPVRFGGKDTVKIEPLRMGEEAQGFMTSQRRRLYTSYPDTYDIEVVMSTGNSSNDWKDAKYTLAFDTIFEQDADYGEEIGSGTVNSGDETPKSESYSLEQGCYNLYTTAGTRPYDVLWEVHVDGELYEDTEGGGSDQHIFGVGGALCDLSNCFRNCYEDADQSIDACASFGDLLAPLSEPNGAQCNCSSDEELELRLECLRRGCDSVNQCYNINDAATTIMSAYTLRLVTYLWLPESNILLGKTAVESVLGQWLDFAAEYVELTEVDGDDAEVRTTSRARNLEVHREGGPQGHDEVDFDWAKSRELQSGEFTRLEFLIISSYLNDFTEAEAIINAGLQDFNTLLGMQDESSYLSSAQAYTVDYLIDEEYVTAADVPEVSIAGTGTQDVDGGDESEDSDDPASFTRETQFLVGAGLVVVVSIALSIVACVVCHMKCKERRDFKKKNEPIDGRPRPVEYVDPWGSVARSFQNDARSENKTVTTSSEMAASVNGHHLANGSQTYSAKGSRGSSAQ